MAQVQGVKYLSTTGSPPMDKTTLGRIKHVLGSASPIAGQQAFGPTATPGSAVSGALGFPIYGMTEAQRTEMKDLAKEARAAKRREKELAQ